MEVINENIWNKYKKINTIISNNYSSFYKVKNINTGNYFGIKEINKEQFKKYYGYDISINKINVNYSENEVKMENYYYENQEYLYLIMELGICNLKEYLNIRKDLLSIGEIKEILFQINQYLQQNKNKFLKLSQILLYSNNINSLKIKILNYSKILNIKQESYDIYNLGKLIYYIIFKKYPDDKLLEVENEKLNNLIIEMLKNNNKFSWEEYFNHPFFLEERLKKINNDNNYNYLCEKHSIIFNAYCENCNCNICIKCFIKHYSHKIIKFEFIQFNENELEQIKTSVRKINTFIEKYNDYIENIRDNDVSLYENTYINNYKKEYIKQLNYIGDFISIQNLIHILNINADIMCEYDIKKEKENKILNCYEEAVKEREYLDGIDNRKEIKGNCKIYLNDKKKDFSFDFDFKKEGINSIKIILKAPLNNLNYMFYECSSLASIDLSNFKSDNIKNINGMFYECSSLTFLNLYNLKTDNVTDMSYIFYECSSLKFLNLYNLKTDNVTDMSYMFYECSSLTSLDLSNFNTNNVKNMSYMFYQCSSLKSLDLSNFNTNKVHNMSYMFYECSSLTSLNLSNFNNNEVTDMSNLFNKCFSLTSLNLYNFKTDKVTDMSNMFNNCSALTSLDLSNFNTKKVEDMRSMFYQCSSLTSLNLSNFKTDNIKKINGMFYKCSSLTSLDLSNFNTDNVYNMNNMFNKCSTLSSLILSNFNTKKTINMKNIFDNCNSLTSLNTQDKKILKELKKKK